MQQIKWGIIGCGGIAQMFARSLAGMDGGRLYAVASRTPGLAGHFAEQHGAEQAYTDYETLACDPQVDAVYVATTHNFHFENVRLCLENGKHVLCEKPFTLNASQAASLAELARVRNLFLMEALWTRFLPAINRLFELLAAGVVGEVTSLRADFCIDGRGFGVEHRLKNRALAGGALLDLGVYGLALARMVFGAQPERVQSTVTIGETGVDARSVALLEYSGGRTATLSCGYSHVVPAEAVIGGTQGYLRIPRFFAAQELRLHRCGEAPETMRFPFAEEENFRYEIEEAEACIASGQTQSRRWPLAETVAVLQTMDQLRAQWSLTYADE